MNDKTALPTTPQHDAADVLLVLRAWYTNTVGMDEYRLASLHPLWPLEKSKAPLWERCKQVEESLRAAPYQERVKAFMVECFGPDFFKQGLERDHRFLEESLELVQANGCTKEDAMMLVEYVYRRPWGDPHQEVGGVMTTLAAVCLSRGLDMAQAGEDELTRVWGKIDVIREKQKTKPKGPLPQSVALSETEALTAARQALKEQAKEIVELRVAARNAWVVAEKAKADAYEAAAVICEEMSYPPEGCDSHHSTDAEWAAIKLTDAAEAIRKRKAEKCHVTQAAK